jgi:hypothetical protein
VHILNQIPESYQDAVVGARLVDVVVYAVNPAPTDSVNGEAGIITNSGYVQVVAFRGNGRQFSERRSILRDQSPLIVANPAGIAALENVITQFLANPENTSVTIDSKGVVIPASTGHEVCVEILVQVDGEVSVD